MRQLWTSRACQSEDGALQECLQSVSRVQCGNAEVSLTSERDIVVMFQAVDSIKLASNVELACSFVQVFDGWVILISTKNFLRFVLPAHC